MNIQQLIGYFLNEFGFQPHLANTGDFAVDIVITLDNTYPLHLGSHFDHGRRTFDLQILDDGHCIAI